MLVWATNTPPHTRRHHHPDLVCTYHCRESVFERDGWRGVVDGRTIAYEVSLDVSGKSLHEMEGTRLSSLKSWTLMLLWIRLFLYLIPFEIGRFVLTVVETCRRLKHFFLLVALIVLALTDVIFEAQTPDRYCIAC